MKKILILPVLLLSFVSFNCSAMEGKLSEEDKKIKEIKDRNGKIFALVANSAILAILLINDWQWRKEFMLETSSSLFWILAGLSYLSRRVFEDEMNYDGYKHIRDFLITYMLSYGYNFYMRALSAREFTQQLKLQFDDMLKPITTPTEVQA